MKNMSCACMDGCWLHYNALLRLLIVLWRSHLLSGAIHKREGDRLFSSPATFLVYIWLAGMMFGILLCFLFRAYLLSLFTLIYPIFFAVHCKILFVLLPFLLSAFAVSFSRPAWLLVICGIKATVFSSCCVILCGGYGQAGWLACWIFLFFDVCSLPLLFFYWLHNLSFHSSRRWFEHIVFFFALMVLILIDYRIVTPYATKFGIF